MSLEALHSDDNYLPCHPWLQLSYVGIEGMETADSLAPDLAAPDLGIFSRVLSTGPSPTK